MMFYKFAYYIFKKSYFVCVLNWHVVDNKILAGDNIFVFA